MRATGFLAVLLLLGPLAAQGNASAPTPRFSPDGQRIAHVAANGDIGIWAAADGTLLTRIEDTPTPVRALRFSADGTRLLTAHDDARARLWTVSDGTALQVFEAEGPLLSAEFSAGSGYVATTTEDGVVELWMTSNGSRALRLEDTSMTAPAYFSPDGTRLLIATGDGLRLEDLTLERRSIDLQGTAPAGPIAEARDAVTRWAQAWRSRDLEGYLGSYHREFEPADGSARQTWERRRRDRVGASSAISVRLSELELSVEDPARARARFIQDYRSESFADRCLKELELARTPEGWRILRERVEGCTRGDAST